MFIRNPKTGNIFIFSYNDFIDTLCVRDSAGEYQTFVFGSSLELKYNGNVHYSKVSSNNFSVIHNGVLYGLLVDKKQEILYDNYLGNLCLTAIKITLNAQEIKYEEFYLDRYEDAVKVGIGKGNLTFSCFNNEGYQTITKKINNFLANIDRDFPSMRFEESLRSPYKTPWDDKQNVDNYRTVCLLKPIIHQHYMNTNSKYAELAKGGFVYLLSNEIVSLSDKTINKHINDLYDYCKDKNINDIEDNIKDIILKNAYTTMLILQLVYKYNFSYEQLKEFKRLFKSFSKISVVRYKEIAALLPNKSNDDILKLFKQNSSFLGKKACYISRFYKCFIFFKSRLLENQLIAALLTRTLKDWEKEFKETIAKEADDKRNSLIESYENLYDFRKLYNLPSIILNYKIDKINGFYDLYEDEVEVVLKHVYAPVEPSEIVFRVQDTLIKDRKMLLKIDLRSSAMKQMYVISNSTLLNPQYYDYSKLFEVITQRYLTNLMVDFSNKNSLLCDLI